MKKVYGVSGTGIQLRWFLDLGDALKYAREMSEIDVNAVTVHSHEIEERPVYSVDLSGYVRDTELGGVLVLADGCGKVNAINNTYKKNVVFCEGRIIEECAV